MVNGVMVLLLYVAAAAAASSSTSSVESAECELTTGRTLTVIKSVRFPEPYGPNVDCRYTVRRRSESICSVTFLFNVLDLDPSPKCSADYLQFDDTGEKFCGSKPVGFSRTLSFVEPPTKKKEVVMSFHSGNKTRGGLGYMVTVVQQECPRPTCNSDHKDLDFSITSPNYPLPYDNERICRYVVHKANLQVCRLALTVHSFELEEDEHCESDFLLLPDGNRLCGTLRPGQIVEIDFVNSTITLEFQSDHITVKNGFELVAHQVMCSPSTADETDSLTTNEESVESVAVTDNITSTTMAEVTPLP